MLWVLNSLTASSYYLSFLGIRWKLYILHSIQCSYTFFLCVWLNLIISSCPALVDSSCWFKALRWRQQCTRKSGSTLDLVQKHHFTTGTGTRRNLDIILLENKDNWKIRFCCPSRIWQQVAKTRNSQNISFFWASVEKERCVRSAGENKSWCVFHNYGRICFLEQEGNLF